MSFELLAEYTVARAEIIVVLNRPEEVRAVNDWFARWEGQLLVSENRGCGCCVDVWQVVGPAEALAELPADVIAHPGIEA